MKFNKTKTAENLREKIFESDMTQAKIAFECGVTPMALHKWLVGTATPTLDTLAALCTVLECEPMEILAFDSNMAEKSA